MVTIRKMDDETQEAPSAGAIMAAYRAGDRRVLRTVVALAAKELASMRKKFGAGTGRPRKVMHNPGPRGGCRCAECRKR